MRNYKGLILDDFQEASFDVIDREESLLVSAPTGSGKTLIADYAIEHAISRGKEIIYTAPIKALSNQKYRDFRKTYGDDQVGILTGDVSINPCAPIVIMTTEIFRNVELTEPDRLRHVSWVIYDEIHYLDDIERGTVWEESLMLKPTHLKVLALSATVPNVGKMAHWMQTIHNMPVTVIRENHRPVPLHISFQCDDRIFSRFDELAASEKLIGDERLLRRARYREQDRFQYRQNRMSTLFDHLQRDKLLPVIYFAFSRNRCESLAEELMRYDFLSEGERHEIEGLYDGLLETFDLVGDRTATYLRGLIRRGIAYHHAGLLPTLKEVIERLFTSRLLKVIFTTETFALGINMPARSVVFDTVRKFYGTYHANLKTRDFYQMAGRAGRRGIDTEGNVFIKVNPAAISELELRRIIYGKPELIVSQFSSNYATLMNLYRDMGERIVEIYPSSFHFFQSRQQDREQAQEYLQSKIAVLKELGYIEGDKILSEKGELAARMYSYELQIGELYEDGFLTRLHPRDLAMVLTALVYEPRKGVKPPPINRHVKQFKSHLDKIVRTLHRVERRFDIFPPAKRFSFHLSDFVYSWYDGGDFAKLTRNIPFDEGELVRTLRMTVQVARELLSFSGFDDAFRVNVRKVLDSINRDVVDAEKQLRQEI
jgi:superfamily II RNA helicase